MAAIDRMYHRFPGACTFGAAVDEHMAGPDRDTELGGSDQREDPVPGDGRGGAADALVGIPCTVNAPSVPNPSTAGQD